VASLDHDGIIGELVRGVVEVNKVSTTREERPTTPCAVFNLEAGGRDLPVVELAGLDGNGSDTTLGVPELVDGEEGLVALHAEDALSGTTLAITNERGQVGNGVSALAKGHTTVGTVGINDVLVVNGGLNDVLNGVLEKGVEEGVGTGAVFRTRLAAKGTDNEVVEGEVHHEILAVHKGNELGSSPFDIGRAQKVVHDDEVVKEAIELGSIRAEAQGAAALGNWDTSGKLGIERALFSVDVSTRREVNVAYGEGETLPASRDEDTEGGHGDRPKRELNLVIPETKLHEVGGASIASRVNATIGVVGEDIDENRKARTTKAGAGKSDAPAIHLEGKIGDGEIAFDAIRLNTARIDEDYSKKEQE